MIVGARKHEQLVDNLAAIDLELSEGELAELDEVSRLMPEYPQYFPPSPRGKSLLDMMADMF